MLVGLTYDLRQDYLAKGFTQEQVAEFDSPRTVEAIEEALERLGYQTQRIGHLDSLVQYLAGGRRWDLVFNIAEGMGGFGREAQVPALLEYYGIPYTFSDPLVLSLTLHKAMAKRVVRDLGLPTPAFAVVENLEQVKDLDLPLPVFLKPVAEGTSVGIGGDSCVRRTEDLTKVCGKLLSRHGQPVLVETYLPGREFTVGIIGTGAEAKVLGVMEVTLRAEAEAGVYSYLNKEHYENLVDYRLLGGREARQAEELALAVWRGLGCRDAGRVDLRCDEAGKPYFLEVNPLAGLHPERSDLLILCRLLGKEYHELIGKIVSSALARKAGSSDLHRQAG